MRKFYMLIAFMFVVTILTACGNNENDNAENEEDDTVTPVEVEKVEKKDFKVSRSVYGNTEPQKQSPLQIEEPGELKTLKVSNGDDVKKDQHVATIKTASGEQELEAPKKGEVAKLDTSEGDMVSDEDPLLVVTDTDKLKATFSLTGDNQKHFEKDDKANLYIDDEKYEGKVVSVDSLPNDVGQYDVKVEMDNDDDLLAGTSAKLEIKETREKDTLIVPTDAIVSETDEDFVFIAEDNQAKKVEVDITETQTDQTAVDADLEKDDEVIVKGQFTLTDEADIDVKEGDEE